MSYLVSVLVPVYGVEQYIERCARSLFEQTYPEIEYVFVNDCTRDKSIEILSTVMDEYPERKKAAKIVGHETNRGLAASRNTAIDNATGEFVCLVDSDDWMELNALELLVTKQLEKDADLVSGNRMVHYKEKDDLLRERKYRSKEEMTLQMMQRSWDHFITGRLFRRSLFANQGVGWNEGLDLAEDRFMMTLLAYHAKGFDTVDDIVYHYERRNLNAISNSNDRKRVFKNNKQELGNVLSLKQFFQDKETVYQKECTRCVMNQLRFNLNLTLAYADQEEFREVVGSMDGFTDDDLKLLGWKKTGIQGWCLRNYTLMRVDWLKTKTIRFIKKRCKRFFP